MIPLTKLFHEPWSHLAADTVAVSFNIRFALEWIISDTSLTQIFVKLSRFTRCRALKNFRSLFRKMTKKVVVSTIWRKKVECKQNKKKKWLLFLRQNWIDLIFGFLSMIEMFVQWLKSFFLKLLLLQGRESLFKLGFKFAIFSHYLKNRCT